MRFMSMVKFNEAKLAPPPKRFLDAMDQLMQDAAKAGCVMVEAGGLLPTANGARVRLDGGKVSVTDGPFTEAKEVIGGYAIFEADSKENMLEWTRRFIELHKAYLPDWEGEAELRQLAGPGEKLCDQAREVHEVAV